MDDISSTNLDIQDPSVDMFSYYNTYEIRYIESPPQSPKKVQDNKNLELLCEIVDTDYSIEIQRKLLESNGQLNKPIENEKKKSTSNTPTVSETDGTKKYCVIPPKGFYSYSQTPNPHHRSMGLEFNINNIIFSNTEDIIQRKRTAYKYNHLILHDVELNPVSNLSTSGSILQGDLEANPVSNPNTSGSKYGGGKSSCHERKEDVKDIEEKVQDKSVLIQPKRSKLKSKVKKNTDTCDGAETDNSTKSLIKQRRKQEKELAHNKNRRNNEKQNNEKSVNEEPVIVATDIGTLLEKFEAESVSNASCLNDTTNSMRSLTTGTGNTIRHHEQPKESNLHKTIREPNQVIDRRKTGNSEKKIMVIPALPNIQKSGHAKRKRTQDTDASLPQSKHPKTVTNNTTSTIANRRIVQLDHDYCSTSFPVSEHKKRDSDKVTTVRKNSNQSYEKQSLPSSSNTSHIQNMSNSTKNNLKKGSSLKSGGVSGNSEKRSGVSTVSDQIDKPPIKLIIRGGKNVSEIESSRNQKKGQDIWNNALNCRTVHNQIVSSRNLLPVSNRQPEKRINILRQDVAGNTKSKPMVSVLKKSINAQQTPIAKNKETTVTTINSSNAEVQNIIVQETEKEYIPPCNEKPKERKKLSFEEYKLRKQIAKNDTTPTVENNTTPTAEKNATPTAKNDTTPTAKNDTTPTAENNTTPTAENDTKPTAENDTKPTAENDTKPTAKNDTTATAKGDKKPVIYCEIFTSTKPVLNSWGELVCTERIYDRVGKSFKEEIKGGGKDRPKPITSDIKTQTDETIFAFPPNSTIYINDRLEQNSSNTSIDVDDRLGQDSFLFGGRSGSDQSESCKRDAAPQIISHRSCPDMRLSFSSESTDSQSHSRSMSGSPLQCSSSSSSPPNYGTNTSLRSRSRDRECRSKNDIFRQNNYHTYKNWKRSQSLYKPYTYHDSQEKADSRRVLHVSLLPDIITKADLRKKFEGFGPIDKISLHFPDDKSRHNYAFVDFVNPEDCHRACAKGNEDPRFPAYVIGFGERRAYLRNEGYTDLDSVGEERGDSSDSGGCGVLQNGKDDKFICDLRDLTRVVRAVKRSKDDKSKCNTRKRERAIAANRSKDDKSKCNTRKRERAIAANRSKDDKAKCYLRKRERAIAARRSRGD